MHLEEAIEILSDPNHLTFLRTIDKHDQALNLGIEALKRIKYRRDQGKGYEPKLLPGETKEVNNANNNV